MRGFFVVILACISGVCAAQPESPVQIEQLAPDVWMHTSWHTFPNGNRFPSNGLVIRDGEDLVLLDSPWGVEETVQLLSLIEKEIGGSVTTAIVTHSHDDRTAGVGVLASRGIPVYAHPLTLELMASNGQDVPQHEIEFLGKPRSEARLGGLVLAYPGTAHATDNVLVWLPDQKVLFGGCAIRAAAATTVGNVADGDIGSWFGAMGYAAVRFKNAELVVPGHGSPGSVDLIQHTMELLSQEIGSE